MIATFAGDSARIMLVQEAINGLPASTHPHYNVSTEDPGGGGKIVISKLYHVYDYERKL